MPNAPSPLELLDRNRPGIKLEEWCDWPEKTLDQMKGVFGLQQYIQMLIRRDPADIERIVHPPPDFDSVEAWQYEHLRLFCLELGNLVVALEAECTAESCPEMRADEWVYLCAAHPTPAPCCAMDYILHTLDGATALLNSTRHFSSRCFINADSVKHFQNVARRLYRIFAHAWYHHKETFVAFEAESHLYARFLRFSTIEFMLIPEKLVIIPPEACLPYDE
ncbi:Mob1/phocein [Polychytrium aggregatum]|uniref:Mob1/phocein n=1 Tax=Polychytrium aggregatum TaxID=110093 RepID=UPI0022FE60D2|nr:Mob1/phocein [Polychytrium aggregatum]KAI9193218.1 Mob1/phocein [Polychytrium aggregatum]